MDQHEVVSIDLGERTYPIVIAHDALDGLGERVQTAAPGSRAAVVSDDTVAPLYGARVRASLERAGYETFEVVVQAGERYKTLDTVETVLDALLDARFDRNCVVVALGGGVLGDMAGFAAAILLRGVRVVQVPTTVVAQVDASVGGKTGVDHRRGKNLIGAFHQPSLVFIDVATLDTLPERELLAGLAEVVKHAVIRDPDLFVLLEREIELFATRRANADAWVQLMTRNCEIKAEVVSQDERETGLRAILNYGHTAGHGIEVLGGFERYRHGEAVLFGMIVAGELGCARKMVDEEFRERQRTLLGRILRQPWPTDMDAADVWDAMLSDKKARDGSVVFVLPRRIGAVELVGDVARDEFSAAWNAAATSVGAPPF